MPRLSAFIPSGYSTKANIINALNIDLYSCLPPMFFDHCHVINLENQVLTLGTESAAWASKLRFYKAEILKNFQNRYPIPLTRVELSICANPTTHAGSHSHSANKPYISNSSAQKLITLANTLQHPLLRDALLKLSRHSRATTQSQGKKLS